MQVKALQTFDTKHSIELVLSYLIDQPPYDYYITYIL